MCLPLGFENHKDPFPLVTMNEREEALRLHAQASSPALLDPPTSTCLCNVSSSWGCSRSLLTLPLNPTGSTHPSPGKQRQRGQERFCLGRDNTNGVQTAAPCEQNPSSGFSLPACLCERGCRA